MYGSVQFLISVIECRSKTKHILTWRLLTKSSYCKTNKHGLSNTLQDVNLTKRLKSIFYLLKRRKVRKSISNWRPQRRSLMFNLVVSDSKTLKNEVWCINCILDRHIVALPNRTVSSIKFRINTKQTWKTIRCQNNRTLRIAIIMQT